MATGTTAKKTTTTKSTAKPRATARKTAPSVEKKVEAAAKANKEAAETAVKAGAQTVKAGAESVTKNVKKAVGVARDRLEDGVERVKAYSSLNRDGVEAVVASGTVLQKGAQAVNAELAAISRRNVEDSMAAMKSITGVKSPTELFELQSDLMRASWDNMLADGNRIGELVSEYTKDAMEPINTQMKKAVEQISQPFSG
ncbi:MAG: phasin family protein [Alphaproteobacteria bacterium]